jgi:hypothetical protein
LLPRQLALDDPLGGRQLPAEGERHVSGSTASPVPAHLTCHSPRAQGSGDKWLNARQRQMEASGRACCSSSAAVRVRRVMAQSHRTSATHATRDYQHDCPPVRRHVRISGPPGRSSAVDQWSHTVRRRRVPIAVQSVAPCSRMRATVASVLRRFATEGLFAPEDQYRFGLDLLLGSVSPTACKRPRCGWGQMPLWPQRSWAARRGRRAAP